LGDGEEASVGDNPARWKNCLEFELKEPAPSDNHHAAMDWRNVPTFVSRLRERDGVPSLALEFLILTACRVNEVLGACWGEIDLDHLDGPIWEIPGIRMKRGKPHRVPLSPRCIEIIEKLRAISTGDYVFPGQRQGRPISAMAIKGVMIEMGAAETATRHGFRSSFKDWATDWSPPPAEIRRANKRGELVEAFPRDLVEVALAHKLPSKVEEAYRRTDMIVKRRRLMAVWAAHCGKGENVITMQRDSGRRAG
jgi:integrase